MAKRSKWLYGCGTGCALLVALGILVMVAGLLWVRGMVAGFEEVGLSQRELESRFGAAGAFVPWADGRIPAERIRAFLAVRDATAPVRERIGGFFALVPDSDEEARALESSSLVEKLRFGMRAGRAGFGFAGDVAEFYEHRNRAMLEHNMGLGEYTYLYATVYYAWLGHPPSDEPRPRSRITVIEHGEERVLDPEEYEAYLEEHLPEDPRVREMALDHIRSSPGRWHSSRARDAYVAQLEGLLRTLGELDSVGSSEAEARVALAARVAAEVEALREDARRRPWPDGVPGRIAESLKPYRSALEDSYSAATNPFELGRTEKRGWSVRSD